MRIYSKPIYQKGKLTIFAYVDCNIIPSLENIWGNELSAVLWPKGNWVSRRIAQRMFPGAYVPPIYEAPI